MQQSLGRRGRQQQNRTNRTLMRDRPKFRITYTVSAWSCSKEAVRQQRVIDRPALCEFLEPRTERHRTIETM